MCGRFVEGAAVAAEVAPAEVVGEDEDDVGLACQRGKSSEECE